MKRFFTLLMAMVCVSMMIAQTNKYEVVGVPAGPEMDRSDWYGWYTASGYVHVHTPMRKPISGPCIFTGWIRKVLKIT